MYSHSLLFCWRSPGSGSYYDRYGDERFNEERYARPYGGYGAKSYGRA